MHIKYMYLLYFKSSPKAQWLHMAFAVHGQTVLYIIIPNINHTDIYPFKKFHLCKFSLTQRALESPALKPICKVNIINLTNSVCSYVNYCFGQLLSNATTAKL